MPLRCAGLDVEGHRLAHLSLRMASFVASNGVLQCPRLSTVTCLTCTDGLGAYHRARLESVAASRLRRGGGGLLLGEQVGVGVGCERHGSVTEHSLRDASCSRLTRRSETVRRMRIAYVGTLMGEARAGWETLGP